MLPSGLVREHLAELEHALDELVERGEPMSPHDARLILDSASARLLLVESALQGQRGLAARGLAVARDTKASLIAWLAPRIGLLYHYPPKPIRLPVRYTRVAPPDPAPRISIVTPSFEQGQFLERTLCSVLEQRYPALEYYVHDGGSIDGSVEILQRYDAQLSGWTSARDDGQADAINRAFSNTSGEIMGWLNSDDLLLPGALACVGRYFAEHPEVDVVYGNRLMIDEHDGQIGAWILPRHDDEVLALADYVPQETLFWRRRVWEASGACLDQGFSYALDWDLLLRFQEAGARMVHLPRFMGAFRVHSEQKTSAAIIVGLEEMARLRERVHGRAVPVDEVLGRLQPYFRRHRILHFWQRLLDRLPLPATIVATAPPPRRLVAAASSPPGGTSRVGSISPGSTAMRSDDLRPAEPDSRLSMSPDRE